MFSALRSTASLPVFWAWNSQPRSGDTDTYAYSAEPQRHCNIAGNIIQLITRLVLDTDVLVAPFRSERGASRELLVSALDERFVLLASTALWLEYEAVLTRPLHLR